MDNNKKQQHFSRSGNAKTSASTTDTCRQKPSSDLQTKNWPKSSRRRENPQTTARGNNNNKQQQNQTSAKVRPNVDKRPRARGYYGTNNSNVNNTNEGSYTFNDYTASSSGLVSRESMPYAFSGEGAVGRFESNTHYYYEPNSVYSPGTKKQNLNHLLNFYYTPREVDYYDGVGGGSGNHTVSHGQRMVHVKKHKYNKEQFLQANFQFVIKASAKRKTDDSPDTLIDWSLIEQINIQTLEEPQCPICLYPPIAAKVTRCGHVYCWPCVLHYLSLSDKSWRKCPICYDAMHVGDLKSATIVQQQDFTIGSSIVFRLMRRAKGSLLIEKYESWDNDDTIDKYPYVSSPMEEKLFSKFILATRSDVAHILAKERYELLKDVDETCPEYVFIQQALLSLAERADKLGEIDVKEKAKPKEIHDISPENEDLAHKIKISMFGSYDENVPNLVNTSETRLVENISNLVNTSETRLVENISNLVNTSETILVENISANDDFISITEPSDEVQIIVDSKTTCPLANESKAINVPSDEEEQINIDSTISCSLNAVAASASKFYYFYQANDGQNIYLHPLNVKMLQACYGSLADAPPVIQAKILQKEQHSMDEDHRRKFTCLGHLPLTCQFSVVEVELQPPYVREDIIQLFKSDIIHRKKERQRRAREEREHEKHIDAINARQMGKLITSTANINISSSHEFPTCGFDDSLIPTAQASENLASTSNGTRKKTTSTSSAGSCSYSSIALNCQQEHSPWTTLNAAHNKLPPKAIEQTNSDDGEVSVLNSIQTNLGDVLAQALSQKNHKKLENSTEVPAGAATNNNKNKKSKKSKKMLPLYSTGMNFSGN